jgi:enoyl-CoA hydratase/carnithine racemase
VALASSHEKTFSSGANLGGFAGDAALVHKHFGSQRFVELFELIVSLPKPTIVVADGHVLAGALGIALACDLVIASEDASFGTPEINVGAFPFMIMALIYRNVPRKKANELLLLGERWSAQEALAAGIVNKVVAKDDLDAAVAAWAGKLAGTSPLIMRLGKEAMRRQLDMPLEDALDYLRSQLTLALSTEDIVEGVTAFFEKREPQWKGR